jgi:hypothetical protein
MKKKNLLVWAATIVAAIFMCSYVTGPATHGWDCTGGETGLGNGAGCSTGSGCHSTTAATGIIVALELDSAGVPVTTYKGGQAYTVKITGTNTTVNNLPRFGFQVIAIKGATSEVTPVNEGTFQQTGLPTGVHYQTPVNASYIVADVIEHDEALSPDSGTGTTGTVYQESFGWTAPAAGTGTVSFWGALNAVNNNGSADAGDLWNTTHIVITEDTTSGTVNSIAPLSANLEVKVYPNPATDAVQIELDNAATGSYNLNIFDLEGRSICSRMLQVSGNLSTTTLNTTGWSAGIYFVSLSKDGMEKVVKIVKR